MKSILIFLVLLISSALSQAQDIAGDWHGTLSAGGAELRLVLHIVKAPDNNLKATLDSIDQPGANGIPVNSITLKDSKLSLDLATIHGTYEGKVAPDANTISGTWTQTQSLPLEFKRANAPINRSATAVRAPRHVIAPIRWSCGSIQASSVIPSTSALA